MPLVRRATLFLSLITGLASATTGVAQDAARSVTFGVLLDGPAERNDTIRTLVQGAVVERLGRGVAAHFPRDKELVADWTAEGTRRALERLLRDREVDVILTLGTIGSDAAAHWPSPLTRPVVAAAIMDPGLQELPTRGGASGVANFTYVAVPRTVAGDLAAFLQVTPIHHLAILLPRSSDDAIPTLRPNLQTLQTSSEEPPNIIPVAASAADALRRLPAEIDAVYVADLPQMSEQELILLADGLRDRDLPSYAASGVAGVRRGFLLSARPDSAAWRMARGAALAIGQILDGLAPGRVPVFHERNAQLTINAATARAIGVSPPWAVLAEAVEVGGVAGDGSRPITLAGAVREAVARNLDLVAQDHAIAGGEARVRNAISPLLPQITGTVGVGVMDEDRAAAGWGLSPERSVDAGLRVSQSVFSEGRWAAAAIERRRHEAREQVRDQLRLDVILEAATAYVEVVRATGLEAVRREHLRAVRTHEETAEIREASGAAQPGEVARWETVVARSRQALIEAERRRRVTEIRFNRVLHRELEAPVAAEEADPAELGLLLTEPGLERRLRTRDGLGALRAFLAREADVGAPELRQLDAAIAAESRARGAATRAFFLPDISFEAAVADRLAAGGAGRASPFSAVATPDDLRWSIGLRLSYPIFTGRARGAVKAQAAADLADLQVRRDAARERVEERVRTALIGAGASFVANELAQDAAAAAGRNVALVGESYRRGGVTVTDLVDSQDASLAARLAAENAGYDFLEDALLVERAVGSFSFFATRADRAALLERLEAFVVGRRER